MLPCSAVSFRGSKSGLLARISFRRYTPSSRPRISAPSNFSGVQPVLLPALKLNIDHVTGSSTNCSIYLLFISIYLSSTTAKLFRSNSHSSSSSFYGYQIAPHVPISAFPALQRFAVIFSRRPCLRPCLIQPSTSHGKTQHRAAPGTGGHHPRRRMRLWPRRMSPSTLGAPA